MVPAGLVGKDINEVLNTLEGLGFVVNELETTSDSYPTPGTVTKVSGAGTQKEIGSTIDVTVSSGPATVAPTTYKFEKTFSKDGAVAYKYQLLDASGNVLLSNDGSGSSVTISKTGMSASAGTVKITWTMEGDFTVDSDGDGVNDSEPETTTSEYTESVNFTAE